VYLTTLLLIKHYVRHARNRFNATAAIRVVSDLAQTIKELVVFRRSLSQKATSHQRRQSFKTHSAWLAVKNSQSITNAQREVNDHFVDLVA
jgi:plasmid stabilization system protein ParE